MKLVPARWALVDGVYNLGLAHISERVGGEVRRSRGGMVGVHSNECDKKGKVEKPGR